MVCSIYYPHSYPFTRPIWTIEECIVKENFQSIYLEDYYTSLVKIHNEMYEKNWNMCTMLEKDILVFLTRINHFEYIFYNTHMSCNSTRNHFKEHITEELMIHVWKPSRYELWKNYDSEIII